MIVGFVNYLRWGHDPIERSGVWLGGFLMDSLILFEWQMETMARGVFLPCSADGPVMVLPGRTLRFSTSGSWTRLSLCPF